MNGKRVSRRIDMAAKMNMGYEIEIVNDEEDPQLPSKDDTVSTINVNMSEGESSSEEFSNKPRMKCRSFCYCCSGGVFRVALIALVILSLALAATGVALIARSREETPKLSINESNQLEQRPTHYFPKYESDYLVAVYYYPWHGNTFHNGDGYLRRDLHPPQQPTLGEYDDSLPTTISQHLYWSRKANIGLWVTSWWGPSRLEDSNTLQILDHDEIGDLNVAVHYETTGRIQQDGDMTQAKNDIEYLCKNYFNHPNYYKIDGRPVIFIYVTRKLSNWGVLEEALLTMRTAANRLNHNVYIVGDHVFADAPQTVEQLTPFNYFDAVTNYDVYGSMGRPSPYAGAAAVDAYYKTQHQWRASAIENGCSYIPVDNDHPPLSRKLTADNNEGSLFAYQLKKAKPLVDFKIGNMIIVNSFNEWHEDTQIEPVAKGDRSSTLPDILTKGIDYVGYEELYLDILRESTIK